jgi:hypothetical protein
LQPLVLIPRETNAPPPPGEETPAHNGLTLIRSAPRATAASSAVAPTLFVHALDLGPRPTSLATSIFFHGLAAAVLWFSMMYRPPIARVVIGHETVRRIDLHASAQQLRSSQEKIAYPSARAASDQQIAAAASAASRQIAQLTPGPQTIIQPELQTHEALTQQIPLPRLLIWSPSKTLAKDVVAPLPEKPTGAEATPSIERPNQEINLAAVNIASSDWPSKHAYVAPGTTSPVAVHLPNQTQLPPSTAMQAAAQPTPAAILSASNIVMKDGRAVLPAVNETVAAKTRGNAPAGNGNGAAAGNALASNSESAGAGQGQSGQANHQAASALERQSIAATSAAADSDLVSTALRQHAATQIALPKDGRFGAIVVGSTLEDRFPEAANLWGGRVAYTAYLHVGLAKSWILQYSLPGEAEAASAGAISRLDAPWPYSIVRPNLAAGLINADALMIHGFVDQSGRFESLGIVFPKDFSSAQFVLAALGQWQFRPALQNSQPVKVEVLLIIPETFE